MDVEKNWKEYIIFYVLLLFFQDFESIVEVKNLETKETYMIHEKVKRDSVWLQMNKSNDKKLRTCTYSKLSGFGHTIYGNNFVDRHALPKGWKCHILASYQMWFCQKLLKNIKKQANSQDLAIFVKSHIW